MSFQIFKYAVSVWGGPGEQYNLVKVFCDKFLYRYPQTKMPHNIFKENVSIGNSCHHWIVIPAFLHPYNELFFGPLNLDLHINRIFECVHIFLIKSSGRLSVTQNLRDGLLFIFTDSYDCTSIYE